METDYDYSEIVEEADVLLKDIENRIKECLKDSEQHRRKYQKELNWHSAEFESKEGLGYKTSLECIKRTREKFSINSKPQADSVKSVS